MPFINTQFFKKGKSFRFTVFFLLLSTALFSQIKVTLPVERSVFQRVNNVASIHIGGNISYQADQIQAKLTPIQGGQTIDWKQIDKSIKGGQFIGELPFVTSGWYKLEVRAMLNGNQIGDISTVSKVGVGEVFIIAGQSNAQGGRPPMGGFWDNTYYGANDDRVNCIDYYDFEESSLLPFPKITQLKAETNIAPHGQASWCWGVLGDRITKELNCPVLFFNAAAGGSRIEQWAQAARGEPTYNYYLNRLAPEGWPYAFLQKSLNYYSSLYGLRAIIWHQGEEDAAINTGTSKYKADLATVISKSRQHSGKNVSWMIAKVSRTRFGIKESIKLAQQMVIDSSDFNTFQGPDTDEIQPSADIRDDGVHFHSNGLIDLANVWADNILTENFFNRSKPFLANPLIGINTDKCNVTYEINASLPINYSNPTWVWNGGNSKQSTFSKTIIAFDENYGLVRDNNTNFLITPPFSFTPASLDIKLDQTPKICVGENLGLKAISLNNNFLWNTGDKTQNINISKSGDYNISVSSTDAYGCIAKAESKFNLQTLPLPPAPIVEALSTTNFCEGGKVEIKGKSNDNYSKIWNIGEQSNNIIVQKSGEYALQNVDNEGCKSVNSNIISVKVNPLPPKPKITTEGKAQFCNGDSLKLLATNSFEYLWKFGEKETKTNLGQTYIKAGGEYKVISKSEFGCVSAISDPIFVTELKLPDTPLIQTLKNNIFCAGDSTQIFTLNNAMAFNWYSTGGNIEASSTKSLNIYSSRNQSNTEKSYFLKITDQNNCVSFPSNNLKITVKANPDKPIIDQLGPYILVSKITKTNNPISFSWFIDNQKYDQALAEIKVQNGGIYSSAISETFILNNISLTCTSEASEGFKYTKPDDALILYPNPVVDGKLYVEMEDDKSNIGIKIFSPTGQQVFTATNVNTSSRILIMPQNLRGFFIVEINDGSKVYHKNIFIKN